MRISTIIILLSAFSLSSCSQSLKKRVGLSDSGPNEYAVTKNKPLEMPPHFDLEEIAAKRQIEGASSLIIDLKETQHKK